MLKPTVQIRDEGGVLTAEFWDCLRLDPAPVQELRKQYESHLRRGGRADLVVDLNGVGFAGSAALGGFLAIHRQARQKGGRLIFCNVDPTVLEVFKVSKIEPLFTFVADKPAALAQAQSGATAEGATAAGPAPDAPPRPAPSAGGGASPLRGRRRKP
jgi:anti-anti-sigma factor